MPIRPVIKPELPPMLEEIANPTLDISETHPEYYGSIDEKIDRTKFRTSFQQTDQLHTNDRFG